jgi:hypothetical protein
VVRVTGAAGQWGPLAEFERDLVLERAGAGLPPPAPWPPRRPTVGDDPTQAQVAWEMYASKQYTVAAIAKTPA